MQIKTYQPERKDLLVNTDWGLPQDQLSANDAQLRGLSLLQGRWVTTDERRQLRDEANAYRSLRSLAGLQLVLALLTVPWTVSAVKDFGSRGLLVLLPGAAFLAGSIGLRRYRRWGRNLAAAMFGLMLTLPLTPAGSGDKGGPFFFIMAILCLYYLFRKTAGRIFTGTGGGQG